MWQFRSWTGNAWSYFGIIVVGSGFTDWRFFFVCFVFFPASHLEFLFLVLCGNSTVKKGSPQ